MSYYVTKDHEWLEIKSIDEIYKDITSTYKYLAEQNEEYKKLLAEYDKDAKIQEYK